MLPVPKHLQVDKKEQKDSSAARYTRGSNGRVAEAGPHVILALVAFVQKIMGQHWSKKVAKQPEPGGMDIIR